MSRHTAQPVNDTPVMDLRQYAALVGVLMAIAAVIALALPVNVPDEDYPAITHECGNGFAASTSEYMPADGVEACADALGTRRAWGWPLGAVGLVIVGGAAVAVTQSSTRRPAGESAS